MVTSLTRQTETTPYTPTHPCTLFPFDYAFHPRVPTALEARGDAQPFFRCRSLEAMMCVDKTRRDKKGMFAVKDEDLDGAMRRGDAAQLQE